MRSYRADNPEAAVAYLRRDAFLNNCLLQPLVRRNPHVTVTVWAAEEASAIVAVMLVEEFPHGVAVTLRGESSACRQLLAGLEQEKTYVFSVPGGPLEDVIESCCQTRRTSVNVALTIHPQDLIAHRETGTSRRLDEGDWNASEGFLDPGVKGEPPLARFLEWQARHPADWALFGHFADGSLVSYIALQPVVDNIWEVATIRTHPDKRRRGYARVVLAYASSALLGEGKSILYQPNSTNEASLRTALSVGYHEAFRTVGYSGQIRARR